MIPEINALFSRDLNKLVQEITLYSNEENIWLTDKNIANSAGNLVLHLVGNLNTYIGAMLGNTGYVRNRDLEFSQKGVPRAELIDKIKNTILVVSSSLSKLSDEDAKKEFPELVYEHKTSVEYLLISLAMHLGYHLGQINYHRRLLDV